MIKKTINITKDGFLWPDFFDAFQSVKDLYMF